MTQQLAPQARVISGPSLLRDRRGSELPGHALGRKGFRPFFLLASLYAVFIVPLWLLILRAHVAPLGSTDPLSWHAHEMLFGYTAAVIAGFLLTAASRWTSRETAVGMPLYALALLWLAGRVALCSPLPRGLAAAIDVAFLPAVAFFVGRVLVRSGNRRNYVMVALLLLLAASNCVMHLDGLGVLSGWGRPALHFSLDLVVVMMVVIGGRVIPMFTRNGTGDDRVRSHEAWDRSAAVLSVVNAVAGLFWGGSTLSALLCAAAAGALIARSRHWGAGASLRDPMLWILHAGNAWIAIGFALRALASSFPALASSATHAFTAGAMGSLTLGMMSRVSLGHTGRMIVASSKTRAAFMCIVLAGLLRVVGPLFPAWYAGVLVVAGTLWALAFALFAFEYAPLLTRPRADGALG
ncbi:MAG: NnrS family protein [Myxococcota bacterium]